MHDYSCRPLVYLSTGRSLTRFDDPCWIAIGEQWNIMYAILYQNVWAELESIDKVTALAWKHWLRAIEQLAGGV